jgi:hypothetical protein
MAIRTFYREPPFRADIIDGQRRVTSSWHLWLSFIADFMGRRLVGEYTVDPASLTTGARVAATATVPGAKAGDFAIASFTPMNADISLTAQVTAADTVTVWFQNLGAGTVDLAEGTLRVLVEKNI